MNLRCSGLVLLRRVRVSKGRAGDAIACKCCSYRGVDAANMQVLLRERYFDPGRMQRFSNRNHYITLQLKPSILVRRPKAKLKIHPAITKAQKVGCGWPLTQYPGI